MKYRNLIFTNHLLDRLQERRITKEKIYEAFASADKTSAGKKSGTIKRSKYIDNRNYHLICTKAEEGGWLIVSAWVNPPFSGTKDEAKNRKYQSFNEKYRNASGWGKFWLTVKKSLGF